MPGLYLAGVNLVEVGCNFDVNIALWAAHVGLSTTSRQKRLHFPGLSCIGAFAYRPGPSRDDVYCYDARMRMAHEAGRSPLGICRFPAPVFSGGRRLETGRASAHSRTSCSSHPTLRPDSSRGSGKLFWRTSFCTVAGDKESASATSFRDKQIFIVVSTFCLLSLTPYPHDTALSKAFSEFNGWDRVGQISLGEQNCVYQRVDCATAFSRVPPASYAKLDRAESHQRHNS